MVNRIIAHNSDALCNLARYIFSHFDLSMCGLCATLPKAVWYSYRLGLILGKLVLQGAAAHGALIAMWCLNTACDSLSIAINVTCISLGLDLGLMSGLRFSSGTLFQFSSHIRWMCGLVYLP